MRSLLRKDASHEGQGIVGVRPQQRPWRRGLLVTVLAVRVGSAYQGVRRYCEPFLRALFVTSSAEGRTGTTLSGRITIVY